MPDHDAIAAPAHQFDDLEQQKEAAGLGMWIFLATEIMFFGGLFTGYTIYRLQYFPGFEAGSHLLDLKLGAINTGVLIASSLTMALGVHAAQMGKRMRLIVFLILTVILGSVFLGVKYFEYAHKWHHHLVPGPHFGPEGKFPPHMELFFSFYFAMTGMHALHMIIGIGLLLVLVWMAWKGKFTPKKYNPVEITGLYWHFVDIVWIFLFPLLYLIGGR